MGTNGGSRGWLGWVAVLVVLGVVALLAWKWATSQEPPPVVTPTPTASPTVSPTPTGFAAVNGAWCPADADDSLGCVTVALPEVTFASEEGATADVYPPDAEPDDDPATFAYDFAPNLGDCWQATVNSEGGTADAAFIFCPAGATSGDPDVDASDASTDRLWITQDLASAPMARSAGN